MDGLFRSLRGNWDVAIAFVLVYALIGIYLGPVFFFLAWFVNGSVYIIHTALRR